jgi:hypothetical protein
MATLSFKKQSESGLKSNDKQSNLWTFSQKPYQAVKYLRLLSKATRSDQMYRRSLTSNDNIERANNVSIIRNPIKNETSDIAVGFLRHTVYPRILDVSAFAGFTPKAFRSFGRAL